MPEKIRKAKKKTLALALSGCSGRAIAYIGFLEVLEENGIKPDMIAACSSATFIACTYASGTMQQFKDKCFNLTSKEIFELFELSMKGGFFSLDKIDEVVGQFVAVQNIEELKLPVAIVAFDLIEGKEVVFSMGNILRAIKASCCIPGLFEPVVWGNKVLIDGSLTNKVPVEAARRFNPDVVIGLDLALNRNFFRKEIFALRTSYNFIKKPFKKMFRYIYSEREKGDVYIGDLKPPGFLQTLDKALDYIVKKRRKTEQLNCDLLIEPEEIRKNIKFERADFEEIYLAGRNLALAEMPKIKKLMEIEEVEEPQKIKQL